MASTPYRPPAHRGLSVLHLSEQLIVVDKPSGLLSVPGRGAQAQRELSIEFQERKVSKRYQALVDGRWTAAAEGAIDLPIGVDWPNSPKQKVDRAMGRSNLTRHRILDIDAARAALQSIEAYPPPCRRAFFNRFRFGG